MFISEVKHSLNHSFTTVIVNMHCIYD